MWAVVVEGLGIFDLGAGCEDKKAAAVWASVGPRRRREEWIRGG
jgi:hypothetical protein